MAGPANDNRYLNQSVLLDVGHSTDTDKAFKAQVASQFKLLDVIDRNCHIHPEQIGRAQYNS